MSNRKKLKRRFKLISGSQGAHEEEVIVLTRNFNTEEPPFVVCTCGWKTEPSENLMELGHLAKQHSIKTGHIMRKHR